MKLDTLAIVLKHPDFAAFNGYVGVNKASVFYRLSDRHEAVLSLEVHGGVTYAGPPLFWFPLAIQRHDYWWIGFDTMHAGDVDSEWSIVPPFLLMRSIRSPSYVWHEVLRLEHQVNLAQFGGFRSNNARRYAGLGPYPARKIGRARRG